MTYILVTMSQSFVNKFFKLFRVCEKTGWGLTFGTTKCRTADILKIQNF